MQKNRGWLFNPSVQYKMDRQQELGSGKILPGSPSCCRLRFHWYKLGTAADPPLPVQINLCGKLDVRGVFQVLGQCAGFVGLEGFLMHAATAMGVASVIVYGGFTAPWQTGYEINANLFTPVPCAPCWLESRCPYDKKCMEAITPAQVADALTEKLRKGAAMISKV